MSLQRYRILLVGRRVLPIGMLFSTPSLVLACTLCLESGLNYHVPMYYTMLVTLCMWYVGYHALDKWEQRYEIRFMASAGKKMGVGLLLVLLFLILGMGSTFFLALALMMAFWMAVWRETQLRNRRRPALFCYSTLGLLILMMAVGSFQRATSDPFDYATRKVFPGTTHHRSVATSFARDPAFDIERLAPMIERGEGNDRDWAFMILSIRREREDFDLLEDTVRSLPDEYFDDANRFVGRYNMYLHGWLEEVAPELIHHAEEQEGEASLH